MKRRIGRAAAAPWATVASVALALAGCSHPTANCPPATPGVDPAAPQWQDVVTDADHVRLRQWRASFVDGLTQARASGYGAAIAAEGSLLDPDAGVDHAAIPDGAYRCRTIALGAKPPTKQAYVAGAPVPCTIRTGAASQHLRWTAGVQRPTGRFYADSSAREAFLGVLVLSDERAPIKYGRDPDRDVVGWLQKLGDRHWRLILPQPAWQALVEVVDIKPA